MNESRALLIAFLAGGDARCPSCHYALRGCTSDRCPECGSQLQLQIASSRSNSGWWVGGVIGLSAAALQVFFILLTVAQPVANELRHPHLRAAVRAGFASATELPAWTPLVMLSLLLLVIGMALANLISRKPAFMRWPWWRRAVVGILAAASPLIVIGLLWLFTEYRS